MSFITIQCRLVTDEENFRLLWELMADKNTPLINELLSQIPKHVDFEKWVEKGKLPAGFIKELCNFLKTEERFAGQSGRFYTSAISLVDYIYKSWLALQQRQKHKLEGKERWLKMLKSDVELEQESNCSLDEIRSKAAEIIKFVTTESLQNKSQPINKKKSNKTKKGKANFSRSKPFNVLFEAYDKTQNPLERCALAYLLKNNCELKEVEEDPEKFAQRRRAKEVEIERLKEQMKNRIPKGRDLTGKKWLEALEMATSNVPKNEDEAKAWQSSLLRKSSSMPFPVAYESTEDIILSKNDKQRIFVRFNGLSKLTFEVYCDSRHLHWFQRFVQDQEIQRNSKDQYSSSLFTLRSGRIYWQERTGKGEPWNVHRLILYCSVDTRLWTLEGTQQVAGEKAARAEKSVSNTKEKDDLNEEQQADLTRKQSMLARINNPFPRPSKPLYQGKPSILVGVSFGRDKPATVAVVDADKNKVLVYRSAKQLLGDNYKLINRQRHQQQRNSHERHKAQKRDSPNSFSESELGQYLDRLLADSIVAIAKTHRAGSIVLPKLGDIREIVQSEIQARAEQKVPGYKEGQKEYAKQYRVSVHSWSYGRLIGSIQSQVAKAGIAVEVGQQPLQGSPQEKARDLAIAAYQCRINEAL
ncbi:type V CRISPR-associated protein Cas12k [Trichocoleus sp. Lan]|uniref:type V CRISPR-associated protein Cas12k n=1 Tax=Trichocoleus sp. Lan TaxID=2933927 RepID=UPI00329A14EC